MDRSKGIVFKVKFNSPNKVLKSPKLNKNHLYYISKRPKAILNDNKAYSLFGKVSSLGFDEFGDINNLKKVADHIENISKNKTTIYKSVISFSEEEAIYEDYTKRDKFEELVKNNMKTIGYNFGIDSLKLEYVASFHYEKTHPHVHIMFWEKDQNEHRGRIEKANLLTTIKALNQYVYSDEIRNLYAKKSETKKSFREIGKDVLSDLEEELSNYKPKFLLPYEVDVKNETKLNYLYNDLLKDLRNLDKGRIAYEFMPDGIKEKLNNFSVELIKSNLDLENAFNKYNLTCEELKKFGIGNKEDSQKDILKNLNNVVLSSLKKTLKSEIKSNQNIKSFNKNLTDLVISFYSAIETKNDDYSKNKSLKHIGDLSKEAKAEYWAKQKHASDIDWENDL